MLARSGCRLFVFKRLFSRQDLLNYTPKNEPILQFTVDSPERASLLRALDKFKSATVTIPTVIGDEEIYGIGKEKLQPCPYNHAHKVAKYNLAPPELIEKAIRQAVAARSSWESRPSEERAGILLKAADLLGGKYRSEALAATMIGQGKTVIQAEIDATVEVIDFFRFNTHFLGKVLNYKPVSTTTCTNSFEYRGTEGFWIAISPFNFTSIGGNLASAPVLMGNVVLWKASHSAVLSNYVIFKVLREAGVPPNVIQFIPSQGSVIGRIITASPDLAGINFTGGVPAFHTLWTDVGKNLFRYKNLPRLIGELGGKNFHFVHPSCEDLATVVNGTIQSAFEYQGQKCSACSRLYVPRSLWPDIKTMLLSEVQKIRLGDPTDFANFMTAVIDDEAFDRMKNYIDFADKHPEDCTIICGGGVDGRKGWFVHPTIIETKNPRNLLMQEEIFGPILTVYVYDDNKLNDTLKMVDDTTQYALTGSIFAKDKEAIAKMRRILRDACGNMYINDKSTGAVVNNQPFGGARWSGTNDKAGGPHYILRFASPLTIKETHTPITTWGYPYMSN